MASNFAELVDFMVCMASICFDCTSFNFPYMYWGLTTIYSQCFTLMYGFSGIENCYMPCVQVIRDVY